jgi:hypothetical protein
MAIKYKSVALFSLLILLGQTLTAQTYCLNYTVAKQSNTVDITVSLMASDKSFKLGSSNLQFKYNNATLSKPTLVSNELAATGAYNGITVTQPIPPSFAKTNDGLVSINFNFTGNTGSGLPISLTGTDIAIIRFQVEDANQSPNLRPYDDGTVGTIVYNDDATSPVLLETTGKCAVYDAVIPSKEPVVSLEKPTALKVYPSLLTNSNSLLTLEVPTSTDLKQQDFHIINVLGEEVMLGKTTTERMTINVTQLSSGTYIVKVGEEQMKFIKQ